MGGLRPHQVKKGCFRISHYEGLGKSTHTHQFLIYADDVKIMSENIHAKTNNTEASSVATKEVVL
jgi:hypothetical protein